MKTWKLMKVWIAIALIGLVAGQAFAERDPLTLVMTHPTERQIRNVMVLRDHGFNTGEDFRLIGVYHGEEKTDFTGAREFVKREGLDWVEFVELQGRVSGNPSGSAKIWTPAFRKLFEKGHGILFTGGDDIPPREYGQNQMLLTEADTPLRSEVELSLLRHLLGDSGNPGFSAWLKDEPEFPILGICLGAQTLNVALGGTLWQDIPSQIYGLHTAEEVLAQDARNIHSYRYKKMLNPEMEDLVPHLHAIQWASGCGWLSRLPASRAPISVLSNHHQAIRDLAPDLVVLARSLDGRVVEAVSHRRFSHVIGVQFHPEVAALFMPDRFFRISPDKPAEVSLATELDKHPGSVAFHRQLWSWFSGAMEKIRQNRRK